MRTVTISKMIHNVLIDGKINTLLVFEDGEADYTVNPLFEAIKQQAERIELLEQQNSSLIKQEEILLNILELSTKAVTDPASQNNDSSELSNNENIPFLESVIEEQE